jgi:hypothetical protein
MVWSEQFAVSDGQVVGLTACGRGTVRLLDMNNDQRVQHRFVLIANGEFDVD